LAKTLNVKFRKGEVCVSKVGFFSANFESLVVNPRKSQSFASATYGSLKISFEESFISQKIVIHEMDKGKSFRGLILYWYLINYTKINRRERKRESRYR
jgi:hypothetical protein